MGECCWHEFDSLCHLDPIISQLGSFSDIFWLVWWLRMGLETLRSWVQVLAVTKKI